ncbi:hypothetical protein R6Q59_000482 [Mikania micrantha]
MAMARRAHRTKLRAQSKEIGGSKVPTKRKTPPPYNICKEDREYLFDMWCGATFLVKFQQHFSYYLIKHCCIWSNILCFIHGLARPVLIFNFYHTKI